MKLVCDGPGPHDPPDGVLGTASQLVRGMRCASPACRVAVDPATANGETLRDRARQALATNATYLARANPTAAQTTAQVQALTKECNALIRLLIGALDDTAGT